MHRCPPKPMIPIPLTKCDHYDFVHIYENEIIPWSHRFTETGYIPLPQIAVCHRPYTRTYILNGTPNHLLYPSLLVIQHKPRPIGHICGIPQFRYSVCAMWGLDTQYASLHRFAPMTDAAKIFGIRDAAIEKDMEQHPDVSKEFFRQHTSEMDVYRKFLLYVGTMFKNMYADISAKKTIPITPDYAQEVYDRLKAEFDIKLRPFSKLGDTGVPVCTVAKKSPADCTYDLLAGFIAPMVIASCYHTAFRSLYEETRQMIAMTEKEELEDTTGVIQEW